MSNWTNKTYSKLQFLEELFKKKIKEGPVIQMDEMKQQNAALAEQNDLTKKQAAQFLESLSDLAYKNAKNGFTIPGLGKLVLVR